MTPHDIDTAIAAIYDRAAPKFAEAAELRRTARRYEKAGPSYAELAESKHARADEKQAEGLAIQEEAKPLHALYTGWARYFLCLSDGGHIHVGHSCPTLRPTTPLGWLPELADKSESEMVEAHGAMVCTVCYPSAPTHPAFIRDAEAAAQAAAEKAEAECPGSRSYDHDSSGLNYFQPRARCNHCGQVISATSTGKLRAHKKEAR